jgi:tripartite-type tricarboxylate transporter receptor subunit TctC
MTAMNIGASLLACVGIAINVSSAIAANDRTAYPVKPIHIIVPTVPGVPPDVVARLLADRLQSSLGRAVVVENRPGAIGTIGLAAVAHAAGDGYTIGMFAMPFVVAPALIKIPYDLERDFEPITLVSRAYSMLAVRSDSPIQSVADLVARARARPGAVTFSSPGNGTPPHLAAALLEQETATTMLHVPYRGPAALTALLSGDVDFTIGSPYAIWPHVNSGKLHVLATTAPQRLPDYPGVPTFVELGYPEVQITDWQGVVAPKGTPSEIIAKVRSELVTILAAEDVRQALDARGLEAASSSSDDFGKLIASELRKWGTIVRKAGIKAD